VFIYTFRLRVSVADKKFILNKFFYIKILFYKHDLKKRAKEDPNGSKKFKKSIRTTKYFLQLK